MQRITGLPDEQVLIYEAQAEAALRDALAGVMDKIARRIEASAPVLASALVLVAADGVEDQGDEVLPSSVPTGDGLPPGQPYVSPDDLASVPPLWQQAVADQILPIVGQVFLDAAMRTHANMIDASSIAGLPSAGSLAAEQYLARARNSFEQIGDSLWAQARSELVAGFEAGESIPQLAERLRQSANVTARTGVLVARTQVNEASNAGSFETARASGLQMQKEWIATPDLRTRPTHLAADGQRVDLNEPFIVGGFSAMFPAASTLPPAERYSCRCTIGYVMPDRAPAQVRADDLATQQLEDLSGTTSPIDDLAATQGARLQAIIDEQHARVEGVIEDVHRRFDERFGREAGPGIDLPARGENPPGYIRPSLRDAKTPRQLRRVWQDEVEQITGFPFVVDAMPRGISMVTAREYAEGTLQMFAQFPGAQLTRVQWFDDVASSSYAQVRRGGHALEFNMRYASEAGRPKFLAARRRDVAGWDDPALSTSWGVRNDLSGQGVVYHEFTHILDIENGREVVHGQIFPLLIRHAEADGIASIDDLIKRRISSYATKNYQEMVAEAGTDVMVNGAAASQLSRDIFDLVRAEYRRRGFEVRLSPVVEGEVFPTGAARSLDELASKTPVSVEPLPGGITSKVERLTYDDGRQAVLKDYGRNGPLAAKIYVDAEDLSADVLRVVGVRHPDVVRLGDDKILMDFVEGRQGGVTGELKAPAAIVRSDEGRRLGLADALLGHRDRGGGNWMITPDGHIVAIDNGAAFEFGPQAAAGNPFTSYILGKNRWNDQIELPAGTDLAEIRRGLQALRPKFEELGRTRNFDEMMSRLDEIEQRAVVTPGEVFSKVAAPRALSTQTVAQLRALAKERGIAIPAGARKADLVKALSDETPGAPKAMPSLEVRTSLSAAEQKRVRTLVQRDPQIFATVQDRYGPVSTSGNLSDADAAWLETIYKRDRVFVERVAQEAQIKRTIATEAKKLGITPTQYRTREAEKLKALVDDKPIIVRRGERGLQDILASGRFKTSLETGRRQPGLAVAKDRRELGESVMGVADDVPLAERPVYGYVGIRGVEPALAPGKKIAGLAQREGQEDLLSTYGQIEIVLKPEIRARTTVTVGDSLDEMGFLRPSPIDNPTADSVYSARRLDAAISEPEWTRRSYVEAQIHGGLRREDILEVVFADDPTAVMVSALQESGIPWRVLRKGDAPIFPTAPPVAPIDEKALLRAAARERNRLIESSQGTAKLLAEVDELIANKASKAAIRQRLDPALIAPEQVFAGADLAVVEALRTALDTGDPAKLRAALTRAGTKSKLKPISKAGAKTKFDPDTMEGVGGIDIPAGAQVTVVRRGTTLTLPDGSTMQLTRAQVTPIAPKLPPSTAKTVAKGDFAGLTRVSEPLGGNPGGIFEASDGSRWYVKAAEEGQAASEALALDLYRAAGLDAPELIIGQGVEGLGRRQVATRFLEDAKVDLRARLADDPAYIAEVQDGFAVDAWLANWDVVGANPTAGRGWDNIVSVAGRPVRIEAGGALRYRGLGGDKPFGDEVREFDTLRSADTAKRAAQIFGDMTPEQIIASAERVRKVTPAKIKALVKKHGLDPELADTLIARRADILRRAAALAPKPPMTAREFNTAIKAAAKGQDALDAVPFSTTGRAYGPSYVPDALDRYRVSPDANDILRGLVIGGRRAEERLRVVRADIRAMDEVMDGSRLIRDVELWRSPGTGRRIFGDPKTWGDDLTGFEWTDQAYSSTTASRTVADRFTKDGGVRLRMITPGGSKAIQLSGMRGVGVLNYTDEAEILLARGARFRVVRDRGWTEIKHPTTHQKIRVRDLDVEVIVPDETPPLPWATK